MPSAWNKLVKKVFDRERKKNSDFKLGDAMKLAAKERKKGGDGEAVATPAAETPATPAAPETPVTNEAVVEKKEETEAPTTPAVETPAATEAAPTAAPAVVGGKKSRKGRKKIAKKTNKRRARK